MWFESWWRWISPFKVWEVEVSSQPDMISGSSYSTQWFTYVFKTFLILCMWVVVRTYLESIGTNQVYLYTLYLMICFQFCHRCTDVVPVDCNKDAFMRIIRPVSVPYWWNGYGNPTLPQFQWTPQPLLFCSQTFLKGFSSPDDRMHELRQDHFNY